jgi:hypothetical protein
MVHVSDTPHRGRNIERSSRFLPAPDARVWIPVCSDVGEYSKGASCNASAVRAQALVPARRPPDWFRNTVDPKQFHRGSQAPTGIGSTHPWQLFNRAAYW